MTQETSICILIYRYYLLYIDNIQCRYNDIWRFPKSWGYLQIIFFCERGFSIINHPAIGVRSFYVPPICLHIHYIYINRQIEIDIDIDIDMDRLEDRIIDIDQGKLRRLYFLPTYGYSKVHNHHYHNHRHYPNHHYPNHRSHNHYYPNHLPQPPLSQPFQEECGGQ